MQIDTSHHSPNFGSRYGHDIEVIVLHSTEGSYEGAISWLCNPDSEVSAHYVVARDGRCAKLVPIHGRAWHVGVSSWRGETNLNNVSIGIEMEHMDGQQDWPDAQVQTVADLIIALREEFGGLPIVSHAQVARPIGRKQDPKDFPWNALLQLCGQTKP